VTAVSELINSITRPLVTIMFAAVLAYGFLSGHVTQEQFIPLVTAVVGFWFGQRTGEKANEVVANAAADRVVARTMERRGVDAPVTQRREPK
jgi:heme O synthase-like polyprenyltransferase